MPPVPPDDGRARPAPGTRYAGSAAAQFLERELQISDERIGALAPELERFLKDQEGALSAIESLLLGSSPVVWEVNVDLGHDAVMPNMLGQVQLGRLLVVKALLEARTDSPEAALRTLEASWRLTEELLARPELISQLIAAALGKAQVGALRKIDAPAFGWPERLRGGPFVAFCLASFENETWFSASGAQDLRGQAGAMGRARRRTADEVRRRSWCGWRKSELAAIWTAAVEAEMPDDEEGRSLGDIMFPNILNALLRARRLDVDAELTALVVDARIERAASRRRNWPRRLVTGTGVCPDQPWTYVVSENGTARIRLGATVENPEGPSFHLPLDFVAGKPRPVVRRTPPDGPVRKKL
ncbi:MAG: hypothetical protein ABI682_09735 [Acidobacteriota bacterium]